MLCLSQNAKKIALITLYFMFSCNFMQSIHVLKTDGYHVALSVVCSFAVFVVVLL